MCGQDDEVPVELRHVFGIIEQQRKADSMAAALTIARHFETEMVAHARHAAAHGCD
jgi:hypothetical protein